MHVRPILFTGFLRIEADCRLGNRTGYWETDRSGGASPDDVCRPDNSRLGTAVCGIENVGMSSVKLRLLAGGGSANHKSSECRRSQPVRVGNVLYPFEAARAAGEVSGVEMFDGSPEWLRID